MVRDMDTTANIKMNLTLKDGTELLNRDIPSQPLGESSTVVSCWEDDVLIVYPMAEVYEIVFFVAEEAVCQ